jgi:hypothetical protein
MLDERVLAVLWESDSEVGQAAALVGAAGLDPGSTSLGTGDRALLALHRDLTGREVEIAVDCPACGVRSEVVLAAAALPVAAPRCAWLGPGGGLRAPTYTDLGGLPDDPDEAAAVLLSRCTVGAPGRAPEPGDLDAVDDSLSGPLVAACSGCGAAVQNPVDVQEIVLRGLGELLEATDVEVHLLARAYRWPLDAIEALPGARRRRLAALVDQGR